jgi:hypothetical protein
VASAAAFVTAHLIDQRIGGTTSIIQELAELAPAGLIGFAAYLGWARLFSLPELAAGLDMARSLLRKGRDPRPQPDDGEF